MEFALRVTMLITLPTAVVLALGPIVLAAVSIGTLVWTFAYGTPVTRARKGTGLDLGAMGG